ncbi:MAG: hypothetical protein QOH84_3017 [Kribbellaceae bacterium]|nr:hypothetical protein [Kribbellaceae bacterium]
MRVPDERDAVLDRVQRPLQAEPRGRLARRPAAGTTRGRDPVRGPGEVEEVGSFGVIQLERSGEGFEHAGGGAGDLATLEPCVVLDAEPGDGRDLTAPQTGDTPGAGRGEPGLVRSDARAAGREELAYLLTVVHDSDTNPARTPPKL